MSRVGKGAARREGGGTGKGPKEAGGAAAHLRSRFHLMMV